MKIITRTRDLISFCEKAAKAPFIALDTEFMRERTFYSKLCLVQIAIPDDEAIIDPLSDELDISTFLELLSDTKIMKVLHAARQDFEIFFNLIKAVPAPVFDTQLGAMALGYGENIGYTALVKGRLGIKLDKGARFTNWSRRPLSQNQLKYAMGDVTHLRDLYPAMVEELKEKGRLSWIEEEVRGLMAEELYSFEPERAWTRFKPRKFKPEYLAVLKAVAAWREKEAQSANIPRRHILKDDGVYDIAQHPPRTLQDLKNLRGVPPGFEGRRSIDRLLKQIEYALDNTETYAPPITAPKHLPGNIGPAVEMLKTLLRLRTEYVDIAPRLVAGVRDLEKLAAYGRQADIKALSGWRKEVFGNDALLMLDGKISLALKKGKVVTTRIGQ